MLVPPLLLLSDEVEGELAVPLVLLLESDLAGLASGFAALAELASDLAELESDESLLVLLLDLLLP